MAVSTALLIVLLAIPAAYGAQHTVGGNSGWDTGVDYTTWAAGQTFSVNDTLLFTYTSNHQVDQVSKSGYDSCSSGNPIQTYTGGSNTVTLSTAGSIYFICPVSGHCGQGMKLAVNVGAANATPPTTPGTSPTTPGTTSPPPPSSTTPSGNGAASIFFNLILGSLLLLGTTFALMG